MQTLTVAVVGATGLVGRTICQILAQGPRRPRRLVALCSPRGAGSCVAYGDQQLRTAALAADSFAGVDLVLMSAGSAVSARWAPIAAAAGALVVDNSACFRGAAQVPLVVPEVNPHALLTLPARGIVANPNCATIQTVVALAPLHRAFAACEVVLCTYQAASGAGREGLQWLASGAADAASGERLAANCVPQIGPLTDPHAASGEEQKIVAETKQILEAPQLQVAATCVRVPVEVGHSVAVHVRFARPFDLALARRLLAVAPGVALLGEAGGKAFATARTAAGTDSVYVGRLRGGGEPHVAAFFCVADNLRKGAATNAVQIAELVAPLLARRRPARLQDTND